MDPYFSCEKTGFTLIISAHMHFSREKKSRKSFLSRTAFSWEYHQPRVPVTVTAGYWAIRSSARLKALVGSMGTFGGPLGAMRYNVLPSGAREVTDYLCCGGNVSRSSPQWEESYWESKISSICTYFKSFMWEK